MNTYELWKDWHNSGFVDTVFGSAPRKRWNWEFPAYEAYMRDAICREICAEGKCQLIEVARNTNPQIDGATLNALSEAFEKLSRQLGMQGFQPYRKEDPKGIGRLDGGWEQFARIAKDLHKKYTELQNQKKKPERPSIFGKPSVTEDEKETARKEAAEIRKKAEEDATSVRKTASEEAEQIREDARQERFTLLADAKQEAATLLQDAENEARSNVKTYMAAEMKDSFAQFRQEWEVENAEQIRAEQEAAVSISQAHEAGCAQTNAFQGDMVKLLDETVRQMNALKFGLCQDLRKWQEGLYQAEYLPICQCYVDLYRMVKRLDNAIRQEKAEELLNQDQAPSETESRRLAELAKQHRNMDALRRRMEKAMGRMDLKVFFPEAGDIFDSYLHTEVTGECDEDCDGRVISSCAVPGVEHVRGEEDRQVLIQAEVILESPDI